MTIQQNIEASLSKSEDAVFVRQDFNDFGKYAQVGRALRCLINKGILIRVGYGVYVKAKTSSLTGKPIPVLCLVEIGIQALAKLGIQAELGKSAKAYMEGKTTQMPMATVLDVGGVRVSRKIGVGKQYVRYQQ